MQDIHINI